MISTITQVSGAILACFASCYFFEAPKRLRFVLAAMGGLCWGGYLFFLQWYSVPISSFLSSVIVAFVSHLLARHYKMPVTVFFIPGFFPLVPGAGMYKTVYGYLLESPEKGAKELMETMAIAGMIALAIFTVDTAFKVYSQFVKRPEMR